MSESARGLALRWSFMGPFETIDLNAPAGVRDYVERYTGRFTPPSSRPCWPVRMGRSGPGHDRGGAPRRFARRRLAERQAWRDRRLMALAAHKRRAERDIGAEPAHQTRRSGPNGVEYKSHHHLRRHRRDSHAVHVAVPAGHARRDRRRGDRARPKRAPPSSTCMRAIRKPASRTSRLKRLPASCRASSRRPMRSSTSRPAARPI